MSWQSLGGRRYVLTLLTLAVSTFLLWFGKLTDGSYTAIVMGTVAAYIAGNGYQKTQELKYAKEPQ